LSAGTYWIRVEGPAYLTYGDGTIKTTGRGCQVADIFAVYKGQISGRALDLNGKPVRNIAVTLMSADVKPESLLTEGKDSRQRLQSLPVSMERTRSRN
jgi:hypothetical protein